MSINRVMLTGNLTREPEHRSTQGGTELLRIGIAVNDRRYNSGTQTYEDVPNFIECVLFGKRAASLAQYLHKGSKVAIEGKLRWSSWETLEGAKRSKIEVIIDDIEFLSPRPSGASYAAHATSMPAPAPQQEGPVVSVPESAASVLDTRSDASVGAENTTIGSEDSVDLYGSDIPF